MVTNETTVKKDAPNVLMLPPTLVLIHIVAGIILNWAVPTHIPHAWGWVGLFLVTLAFGITKWAKAVFDAAGTNVAPNKPATAIVRDGPFAHTRNPMYLSFILGFIGLALLAGAPLMLLLTLPLFYILDQHVIYPEEIYLIEKFGTAYTDYTAAVRRWI